MFKKDSALWNLFYSVNMNPARLSVSYYPFLPLLEPLS